MYILLNTLKASGESFLSYFTHLVCRAKKECYKIIILGKLVLCSDILNDLLQCINEHEVDIYVLDVDTYNMDTPYLRFISEPMLISGALFLPYRDCGYERSDLRKHKNVKVIFSDVKIKHMEERDGVLTTVGMEQRLFTSPVFNGHYDYYNTNGDIYCIGSNWRNGKWHMVTVDNSGRII